MNTPQVSTSHLKALQVAKQFQFFMISLILISAWPLRALAQDSHWHTTQQQQELTPEPQSQQSALLKIVRESTARSQDVRMAESKGYSLEFDCVSGPDSGAMGLHSLNDTLVGNGIVDATRPQIVLYEAQPNGDLKLTGGDYLILASLRGCETFEQEINGAAHKARSNDTPWSYRDANWSEVIVGVDPERANRERITAWAKDYWEALHPYGAGGAYLNFTMEGEDRIRATYGSNYERLARVKAKHESSNFFRVNQNIRPDAGAEGPALTP